MEIPQNGCAGNGGEGTIPGALFPRRKGKLDSEFFDCSPVQLPI
jgi:hypothetical protein